MDDDSEDDEYDNRLASLEASWKLKPTDWLTDYG